MNAFLNLSGGRRIETVRQSENSECGLASLAMVAGYHGYEVDLAILRRRFKVSMKGMTLRTLIQIASAIGISVRAVRCEPSELVLLQKPAILHWGGNHFVVLERATKKHVVIHDPAHGRLRYSSSEVMKKFTGVALELTPNPEFVPKRETNPLKLSSLIRFTPDVNRALLQSAALSVMIEFLVLIAPFYFQVVIDNALVSGDLDFLTLLAICFGTLGVFRVVSSLVRGLTFQFIGQTLTFDMQSRLFHHMLRLPLEWFHKRHVGDIQSRFGSVQPIQDFVSNGAIAALLDFALGVVISVVLFFYSPLLGALTICSMLAYLLLRIATIQTQRKLAGDTIIKDALEQTKFLENLRAVETIKAGNVETMRDAQQRTALAAAINARIRARNLDLYFSTVAELIDAILTVLIIYLGARSIIDGSFTIGMLTAFLAYKLQFGMRMTNVINQYMRWRLLSVDLNRLGDIALSNSEKRRTDGSGVEAEIRGDVRCSNLSFRYAFGERAVLGNVRLAIGAGEYVAICGESGGGKSTLIKLLTGLYEPTGGDVLIDGIPISQWNLDMLRAQIAVVSQDDQLLAGSIMENISMFDEDVDAAVVKECAEIAQIAGDISRMPMGYETLVGDMGSSLSGGQKQRVMLARALYRKPRILILDEGTSHLDVATEKAVNDGLAQIGITRIVVAHRPETIAAASRRLLVSDGNVTEMTEARPAASAPAKDGPHDVAV